ncbi:TnsA endonuclease N-terminal domain-containing protein [Paraburkholderia sp. BCC1876]|uniref:TnsA endonuclease N-terminal domain-containing protein n=1 Tax=Paraburkholderia sp. BCC1876 TaxID=2676303 RepID=UPI0015923A75|nr:TnsA endonuclease N-terminal domain-containing protein [Paraburkholderia sp. BCC1876]
MAKRRYVIDSAKIARFIKEGRGQGSGATYKPWLTIQDVPSDGRAHRAYGWKTKRVHHLLSDIEYRHFLLLDWATEVTDIREQFPLDFEKTREISENAGIKHPKNPRSDELEVMTTDFLVFLGSGANRKLVAWAIKPAEKLNDARVIEKLEIERRYWAAQGNVQWHISTERELPLDRVEALDWMHGCWDLSGVEEPRFGFFADAKYRFASAVDSDTYRSMPLNDACSHLDVQHNCMDGTHLMVARHLLARRALTTAVQTKLWQAEVGALRLDEAVFRELMTGSDDAGQALNAA